MEHFNNIKDLVKNWKRRKRTGETYIIEANTNYLLSSSLHRSKDPEGEFKRIENMVVGVLNK